MIVVNQGGEQELTGFEHNLPLPGSWALLSVLPMANIPVSGCKMGEKVVHFLIKTGRNVRFTWGLQAGLLIVALLRCVSQDPLLPFWSSQECARFHPRDDGNNNIDRMRDTPAIAPGWRQFCIKPSRMCTASCPLYSPIGWPDGNTFLRHRP